MTKSTQTTERRPAASIPFHLLPTQLRKDADEMNGWGAGNEAEHVRQAADEIERLQRVIDSRPAINAGLPATYIAWSQSVYVMEHAHITGAIQQ